MNTWLNPSEGKKPRSEYGWKFWKWYNMTTWDYEVVSSLLSKLQQKHENWYVTVEEIVWIEDAIDKVYEIFWIKEAEKLVSLIKIAREKKMYSWFVQDLIDWINQDRTFNQWVSFWILHSSIEKILSDFRDEIEHNLENASRINNLLPKNGD